MSAYYAALSLVLETTSEQRYNIAPHPIRLCYYYKWLILLHETIKAKHWLLRNIEDLYFYILLSSYSDK